MNVSSSAALVFTIAWIWADASLAQALAAMACGAVTCVAVLALYPQIVFERERRKLETSPAGIAVSCGKCSETKTWDDVATIRVERGIVNITLRNMNAFLIPTSAFRDDQQRELFLSECRAWLEAATSGTFVGGEPAEVVGGDEPMSWTSRLGRW